MQTGKWLFLTSLLLAASISWAGDRQDLIKALDRAATQEQTVEAVTEHSSGLPKELHESLILQAKGENWKATKQKLDSAVAAIALANLKAEGRVKDAQAQAREILAKPGYKEAGPKESRNWLTRAIQRLGEEVGEWLRRLLQFDSPDIAPSRPTFDARPLFNAVFIILGIAALGFAAFFLVKLISDRSFGARKAKGGMLEDDEPERTADEWLNEAERLEAQGKYREAVRCLYLACLIRLDEAGVARFIRAETNWEHCRRIMASSLRPGQVEFREPTRRFDIIWYGKVVKGEDVPWFRSFYSSLIAQLKERLAA